jgi:MATE family multidrug resistance protein
MVCTVIGTLFHIFWCYILIFKAELDIIGVSIATCITNFSILFLIHLYAYQVEDIKEAWFLPDRKTYEGLKEFLKIAIPGTLMLCSEWWLFELLTLLSGYLEVEYTAA